MVNRFSATRSAHWMAVVFSIVMIGVFGQARIASAQDPQSADTPAVDENLPYLDKDRDIKVFDPPELEKFTAIRQAAERLLQEERVVQGRTLANRQSLAVYEYTLSGENEEAIVNEARIRALKSAAARLYFDQYFLLGRDLLEPYLRLHGKQFIASTNVSGRRILANGQIAMSMRLGVNLDKLYRDLDEKRFIARPNLRPIIGVLLHETLEGKDDPQARGRQRTEQFMQNYLIRANSREMSAAMLTTDLTQSAESLFNARMEAQRNNIDVLISGTLEMVPFRKDEIFYDDYQFCSGKLSLKMYRVDNGEVIASVEDSYSAAGEDVDRSIDALLDTLMARAGKKMVDALNAMWGPTMLDDADYRLLLDGVEPGRLTSVTNALKTISPEIELFERAHYGDVLVLNVKLPAEVRNRLEIFLRESTEPQFKVEKVDPQHFELKVL